ncbi:hypothetical protein Taro_013464, partial [Colocasia esculenta]|nr:hypothetical protein [Colocasia esculenta]
LVDPHSPLRGPPVRLPRRNPALTTASAPPSFPPPDRGPAAAAESMAAEGTLDGILGEIQALVADKLQVVSYKWLSRKFSVSSNDAKRLLQEFVMKHGSEFEAIYTLSGWLKKHPGIYNVRLVSGSKLTDAKQDFLDNYSVQVYSVQTCVPKDPAVLWSSEFVQAEELFDQSSTTENCLRDNRFCGVSNSFVKRIVNGKSIASDAPKTKIASGIAVTSKTNGILPSFPTPQQGQTEQPKPKTSVQTSDAVNTDRNDDTAKPNVHAELSKAHEALNSISSDDEGQNISCKESNGGVGRKRRVVFDFSDDEDEENIVSLASPEPPHAESSKKGAELEKSQTNLNFDDQKRVEVKQEKTSASNHTSSSRGEFEESMKNETSGNAITDKAQDLDLEKHTESKKRDQAKNSISTPPKRKKVLKTRIDERGREVTEVVWEGDAAETNKATSKTDTIATDNGSESRLPPADKPAASHAPSNPASKTGNTKTKTAKDSKQANILSFFKKA